MAQPDAPDAPAPTDAAQRLIHAIRAGDEGRVEAALRDGASANTTTTGEESKYLSAGSASALVLAIVAERVSIVKLVVERGDCERVCV